MRRFLGASAALALVIASAGQAYAGNILYYTQGTASSTLQYDPTQDNMLKALNALAPGDTYTTATSPTDFVTKLTSGLFQVGIYSTPFTFDTDPVGNFTGQDTTALTALKNFVQSSPSTHKGIVNDNINFGTAEPALNMFGADTDSGTTFLPPSPSNVNLSNYKTGITNPLVLTSPAGGNPSPDNPSGAPYGSGAIALSLYSGPNYTGAPSSSSASFASTGDSAIVTGYGGSSIVNAFASDTGGSPQVQLYENEINALLAPAAVPEPATLTVVGFGVAGMVGYARLRRKKRLAV
jgi:hypothetical protein